MPLIYVFEDFELDPGQFELRQSGAPVKIEPKTFNVLAYLLENRARVVPKAELLASIWPKEHVVESVLPKCVAAARKALGDSRSEPRMLQTAHGRGYRFIGEVREQESDPGDSAKRAGAFVGREAVMAELRAAMTRALKGRGEFCLLAGEAGVGKTRVAQELSRAAHRERMMVLQSGASEGPAPFELWVKVLRDCLAEYGIETLAAWAAAGKDALAGLLPELRVSPSAPQEVADSPYDLRFQLFDAIGSLLKRAAEQRPILIFLDDLHAADAPSLSLLSFLRAQLRDSRVLLLGAYRKVGPESDALAALTRDPESLCIVLKGLKVDAVAEFLGQRLGPLSNNWIERIHQRTNGNPFFLMQIGELLRLEDVSHASPRLSAVRDLLPSGVRDAVLRRLEAVSEDCRQLLSLASVIGGAFELRVLNVLTHFPADKLLDILEEAVAIGVIQEDRKKLGRYLFPHVLIADTLYEELTTPTRVRLHFEVGEALERTYGALADEHVDELAHHFFQGALGGATDKAIVYATKAAVAASRLLAFESAMTNHDRALSALDHSGVSNDLLRCEMLLSRGDAELSAGKRVTSRQTFIQVAKIAKRLANPLALAKAALGATGGEAGFETGEEVCALLEDSMELLPEEEVEYRSRLLGQLAMTPPHSDSMQQRNALSQEALALARESSGSAGLVLALRARIFALVGPGHLAEAIAISEELLTLANRPVARGSAFMDRSPRFMAHYLRYRLFLTAGRMAAADRELEGLSSLVDRMRLPEPHWYVAYFRASRALSHGQLDDAERLIEQAHMAGRQTEYPYIELMYRGQSHWLALERGENIALQGNAAIVNEHPWTVGPYLPIVGALARARMGLRDEARRELETISEGLEELPEDEFWLMGMGMVAELCWILRDEKAACRAYELLARFPNLGVVNHILLIHQGSVQGYLGMLASAAGDRDKSLLHFAEAVERDAEMEVWPSLVSTQLRFARVLTSMGRKADLKRARGLLEDAEVRAKEMGLTARLARVRAFREKSF